VRRRADQLVAPWAFAFHKKAEPDDEVNRRFSDLGGERRRTARLKGVVSGNGPTAAGSWGGREAMSTVLLFPTLLMSTLTLATGRTTLQLQGAVHLVVLAVCLFTTNYARWRLLRSCAV